MNLKKFEVAYYDDGTYVVERYEAEVKMQVRSHLNHKFHRQVKLEYIKEVEVSSE